MELKMHSIFKCKLMLESQKAQRDRQLSGHILTFVKLRLTKYKRQECI